MTLLSSIKHIDPCSIKYHALLPECKCSNSIHVKREVLDTVTISDNKSRPFFPLKRMVTTICTNPILHLYWPLASTILNHIQCACLDSNKSYNMIMYGKNLHVVTLCIQVQKKAKAKAAE